MIDQDLKELITIVKKITIYEDRHIIKVRGETHYLKPVPWELINQRDVLRKRIEKRLKKNEQS